MGKGQGGGFGPPDDEPPGAAITDQRPDRDHLIDAAFARIARDGWLRLSLAAVAEEAGVPILQVYRTFSSKHAILCALARRVDETVLAEPVPVEPDERPRDRVFDLLMRRFDALQPYKRAFLILRRELPRDPAAAVVAGGALLHSLAWMIEAAGISATGWRGVIAAKLTLTAYVAAQRVWLRDESPDLAQTMAELDRRLRGIERWYTRDRRPGPAENPVPT
jgi:AcrR family transcriptional regulator